MYICCLYRLILRERYDGLMKDIQEREAKARDKCIGLQRTMQQQQAQASA